MTIPSYLYTDPNNFYRPLPTNANVQPLKPYKEMTAEERAEFSKELQRTCDGLSAAFASVDPYWFYENL